MRRLIISLLCLLPCAAQAAKLANCDPKPYDVTIVNGGQKRVVTLTPAGGIVQEFGPLVSFQIEGQKPVSITNPDDEYCIWHGHITIQRRNLGDKGNGFGH